MQTRYARSSVLLLPVFVIVLVFYSCGKISAQSFCETPPPTTILYESGSSGAFDLNPMTVRIFVHVIRRSDGTGGLTPMQVDNTLSILTQDFADANICFSLLGEDFIDSDTYFNFASINFHNLVTVNAHSNAVDIYLLRQGASFGGRANGIPSTALVIEGNLSQTSVISHEMGHCLGLYHTHSGRGCGDFVNCAEAIDGSNCTTCGDLVCDTPADPCLSGQVTNAPACTYTGPIQFNPLTDNIMSYTRPECMANFTEQQFARILDIVENHNDAIVVDHNVTISNTALNGNPQLYAVHSTLTAETSVDVNNSADVTFEAGEEIYLKDGFQVHSGAEFLAHIQPVCNVIDRINSAKDGLQEFSQDGAAPDFGNESQILQVLKAYPNPFAGKTTLDYYVKETCDVSLDIYDIFGRKVAVIIDVGHHNTGWHSVSIKLDELNDGTYFYRFQTMQGTVSGKLQLVR